MRICSKCSEPAICEYRMYGYPGGDRIWNYCPGHIPGLIGGGSLTYFDKKYDPRVLGWEPVAHLCAVSNCDGEDCKRAREGANRRPPIWSQKPEPPRPRDPHVIVGAEIIGGSSLGDGPIVRVTFQDEAVALIQSWWLREQVEESERRAK